MYPCGVDWIELENNLMSYFRQIEFSPEQLSAFGALETGELTPVIQIDFVYGINSQAGVGTTLNSATVDTSNNRLRLQTGTNTAGSAVFSTIRPAKYRAGQGMVARFTGAFTTGAANSTQILGAGTSTDGYFFGYNGTAYGILHRNNGSDTWIPQASWNGDKLDGTGHSGLVIDPTLGNVYQIKYPYLGYGNILFFVLDPVSAHFTLVHTIRYPNTTTAVQLGNPNLFFYGQAVNSGNNTNLTTYCGSVGFFISGIRSYIAGAKWAADNYKTSISTETVLFNLRNATTYNTKTNRSLIRLHTLTVGAAGTANRLGVVRLYTAATIGGSPSFTPVNGSTADNGVTITSGNSVASVDTAGTTSAGLKTFNQSFGIPGTGMIDLTPFELFIAPGQTLSVTAFASGSSDIGAGLSWSEDV